MFYRHWKKIVLALTAFFWVSCTYEDEAQPLYGVAPPPVSSSDNAAFSSSSETSNSSGIAESSSSEGIAESSSSAVVEQSSSSLRGDQYRMGSNPDITCIRSNVPGTNNCLDAEDKRSWTETRKKMLEENQTRTLAELDSLEDDLIVGFDYGAPEYGVPDCTHRDLGYAVYKCTNNETYSASSFYSDEIRTLYTEEEYRAKYPEKFQSSSSAEPESSSATPPSPLCQKTDFATTGELRELFETDKATLLDSVKAEKGETLSPSDSSCLSYIQELGGEIILKKNKDSHSVNVLAKKQICDGDTTVNPHYQKQIEKIENFLKREIDDCLTPPDPAP
ncbi:hypothetical protein [uncultured Fibrobacter sp.]|uniref:hypothetical protein n=1 Tax=uncultured Fibrobacter sp. TaxID=261512 RepID=UPI00261CDC9C|nr:hypothetical protein [uncultured Fibrobacter sp.]